MTRAGPANRRRCSRIAHVPALSGVKRGSMAGPAGLDDAPDLVATDQLGGARCAGPRAGRFLEGHSGVRQQGTRGSEVARAGWSFGSRPSPGPGPGRWRWSAEGTAHHSTKDSRQSDPLPNLALLDQDAGSAGARPAGGAGAPSSAALSAAVTYGAVPRPRQGVRLPSPRRRFACPQSGRTRLHARALPQSDKA